jgi:hypothetical protein
MQYDKKKAVCQNWEDISEPCRIQVDTLVRDAVNWDISIFHLSIPIDVKMSGKYRFQSMNARPVIESIKTQDISVSGHKQQFVDDGLSSVVDDTWNKERHALALQWASRELQCWLTARQQ